MTHPEAHTIELICLGLPGIDTTISQKAFAEMHEHYQLHNPPFLLQIFAIYLRIDMVLFIIDALSDLTRCLCL